MEICLKEIWNIKISFPFFANIISFEINNLEFRRLPTEIHLYFQLKVVLLLEYLPIHSTNWQQSCQSVSPSKSQFTSWLTFKRSSVISSSNWNLNKSYLFKFNMKKEAAWVIVKMDSCLNRKQTKKCKTWSKYRK